MKYRCFICNYIYDEEKEEISFDDLDDEWICPECDAFKSEFELIEKSGKNIEETNIEEEIDENFKNKYLL